MNIRGESLLEYIPNSNLSICHRGDNPPFINPAFRVGLGGVLYSAFARNPLLLCNIETLEELQVHRINLPG